MSTLRKYIIAGLLVWLPLVITVVIVRFVVNLLDKTILLLPADWQPSTVLGFALPGFGIVLAVAILLLTGAFAANLFGRRLVSFWERALNQIPLVRSIYNSAKQILSTLFDASGQSFRKVVLLEYPRKGIWSVGFLTNESVQTKNIPRVGQDLVAIFIPTTPNPTSGFIIMIAHDDIIELDMSIEEGFKLIISVGVITPDKIADRLLESDKVA